MNNWSVDANYINLVFFWGGGGGGGHCVYIKPIAKNLNILILIIKMIFI